MSEKISSYSKKKLGFIGAGTVGTALAYCLAQKGYPVVAVASRSLSSAERLAHTVPGCQAWATGQEVADQADLVFITTPDDVIPSMAGQVVWRPSQMVVHCSGADSTDVLEPARRAGAWVGVFHPLQSFASPAHAMANLTGSTFALEGEVSARGELETLKEMAEALGGRWIRLSPGDKVLYHAAAVMACNYTVTLVKLATDLWETFGISRPEAVRALLPLLKGTVRNLEEVGIPGCLTGPVARGDMGTVRKHLEALERSAPHILTAYRELGRQTIPIALEKGRIDPKKGEELRALLDGIEEFRKTMAEV